MHHVAGLEFPAQLTGRGVDGVEISVTAAEINCALRHYRAGEKNIESIGDGLVFRPHPVQALGLKAAFPTGGKFPARPARARVEGVKFSVVTQRINHAVAHRRARRRRTAGGVLPKLPSVRRVDRVDVAVVAAEIDHPVMPDRRGNNPVAGREFPFDPVEGTRCRARVHSGVRRTAPEHRLRRDKSGR